MKLVHWILSAGGLALLAWAAIRWKSSPSWHPEYGVRRDITLILVLLLAAVAGDAVRGQFREGSAGFLISSIVLIPVAIGALALLFRLIKAYRVAHAGGETSDIRPGTRSRRE